jgi:hypothetical protein
MVLAAPRLFHVHTQSIEWDQLVLWEGGDGGEHTRVLRAYHIFVA